jgi:short subunit dehydrogenase-like uncharacterized protein
MTAEDFDITVYGATGFTGRQAAQYLRKKAPELRIGLGGRNRDKLSTIAGSLGLSDDHCLVADSQDQDAVSQMVGKSRVIINTAGPFARYGEGVIKACVDQKRDYVDITGETPFVADMIERYHEQAHSAGVKIVPLCGFDSVPSDLGVLWLVDSMKARGWTPQLVKSFFRIKGGFNGGTIASALTMAETGQNKRLTDPQLLNPSSTRDRAERKRSYEPQKPVYDSDLGIWSAPFFMAPINSAVVRRSRALWQAQGQDYGPEFEYHERLQVDRQGKRLAATIASAVSGLFLVGTLSAPGRRLISRLAPQPGEGPSEEAMDEGFFRAHLVGKSQNGDRLDGKIEGQGDPGNRITVKILCESALLLRQKRDQLPGGEAFGGILTPATAFGLKLKDSLVQAGISFNLEGQP